MTRLQQHQQKQFMRKLVFILVILVVLMILMVTVGLKLLINATLFITGNSSAKNQTTTDTQQQSFFGGSLEVDSIPQATNSAQIIISGTSANYDTLNFYLNDEKVKTSSVDGSGSFTQQIGDLNKGTNTVYVEAATKDGKEKKKSTVFSVTYSTTKPKLDISEPGDNSKTSNQDIKVSGKTDKEIFIRVNDSPVVVDADGNFTTNIHLNDGDNKIVITAQDSAGNIETKTLTVNYNKDN